MQITRYHGRQLGQRVQGWPAKAQTSVFDSVRTKGSPPKAGLASVEDAIVRRPTEYVPRTEQEVVHHGCLKHEVELLERRFNNVRAPNSFYSTWSSSYDEDDSQHASTVPAQAVARVVQGMVQVTGTKGSTGPRACQDYAVATCHNLPLPNFLFTSLSSSDVNTPCDVSVLSQTNSSQSPSQPGTLSQQVCVSAVFDGHGRGEDAPILAAKLALERLAKNTHLLTALGAARCAPSGLSDQELMSALRGWYAYYHAVDSDILTHSRQAGTTNGTTALVTLITGNRLYSSNAGDSRAVLSRAGRALRVSRDHCPSLPDEAARIAAVGGPGALVAYRNTSHMRVSLLRGSTRKLCAVSRALGDRDYKEAGLLVCDPDVSVTLLQPHRDQFVIAASDGLWCAVDDQEAVEVVHEVVAQAAEMGLAAAADAASMVSRAAANRLMDLARDRGSKDDITVIVNMFEWQ